ncbi:hypothetical protein BC940DRAFT_312608 [Gongronella butleri]|nr:hypothetical protein BC940DRAFT_312608 [Gongronella butleri]
MQTLVTVSKDTPIVVGRHSGTSQVQVGKRKRYISRHHLKIEYNSAADQFEVVVLGKQSVVHEHQKQSTEHHQHARFVVHDRDKIKIVDETIVIALPPAPQPAPLAAPPPSQDDNEKKKIPVKQEAPHQLPPSPPQQDTNSPPSPPINIKTEIDTTSTSPTAVARPVFASPARDHDQEPIKKEQDAPKSEIRPELPRTSPPTTTDAGEKQDHATKVENDDKHAPSADHETGQNDDNGATVAVPTANDAAASSSHASHDDNGTDALTASENDEDRKLEQDVNNIIDLVIEALVFSKKSSLSIPDIYTSIIGTNPTVYKTKGDKETWMRVIQKALDTNRFFRTLTRTVSPRTETPPTTHHGKGPHEQFNYYYDYSLDPVEWRQSAYADVGRTARRCTVARGSYEERPLHDPPFKRTRRR